MSRQSRIRFTLLAISIFFAATVVGLTLESFDLNLASDKLFLTFDEAVSASTEDIDWAGVSLRTHASERKGSGVTLWKTEGGLGWGAPVSTNSGRTLSVSIHPTDLDKMKALHVGHNSSFTWLTLRRGAFVSIIDGKGCEPVYGTQVFGTAGMSVNKLVQDSSRPTLDRFTLGLNARQLVLFFSEGVSLSAFEPSALFLSRTDGTLFNNASLNCSSPMRIREDSWREIVLQLDAPCPITNISLPIDNSKYYSGENASVEFVNGSSNDWGRLVDSGVVWQAENGSSERVLLSAFPSLLTDLSAAGNDLVAASELEQSFPDCQPCGNGTFRSEPCTEVFDAVCTACTAECPGGDMFILSPCTAETDLDCHRCTSCPFGTRETGGCERTFDRVCEACSKCAVGEFESRECNSGGDDRICESCLRCSMSPEVAEACRDFPLVLMWQQENCCETVEGEKVPCARVVFENLRVSAREGRRHWVFESSIPPVDGYTQDYWGQGRAGRDAVTPRDQLIEVEFREGARSVFDDPRYLGQEGPTGGFRANAS